MVHAVALVWSLPPTARRRFSFDNLVVVLRSCPIPACQLHHDQSVGQASCGEYVEPVPEMPSCGQNNSNYLRMSMCACLNHSLLKIKNTYLYLII